MLLCVCSREENVIGLPMVLAELGFESVEGQELITSSIPNNVNVPLAANRVADE